MAEVEEVTTLRKVPVGIEQARRDRAVLIALSGADAGRVLPLSLNTEVTFGREERCTYSFADGSLSRVHAKIVFVGEEYVLEDEGSTNGTFVDDERIGEARKLRDGMRVQFGVSLSFRFSLVTEEEQTALRRVYDAALKDGLTGLFNRKHTDERLDAELAYAMRHSTPLSIAMIDIDHFKRVNDTHGHPAGDAVLRFAATSMLQTLRATDVLGRYGGEEFLVIARGANLEEARLMAERLRVKLASTPIAFDDTAIAITASLGIASVACCSKPVSRDALVALADERLYRAKAAGRNQVVGT